MKFVLVNSRIPRPQVRCTKCDQPIETSYLREIGTHLIYCNHNCYEDRCQSAILLLDNRARSTHPTVGDESAVKGRT
jgi:hypothetical protein